MPRRGGPDLRSETRIKHHRRLARDRSTPCRSHCRARPPGTRAALAALLPLFLAACGGGGGGGSTPPPPVSPQTELIYGTAATGSALSGTVVIEDAAGHTASLPVAASSGSFSASVTGMRAPFMLKATSDDGKTVLYSAVAEPGLANVTPLTTLALLRVAAQQHLRGPADLYAAPAGFDSWLRTSDLADASASMLSRLMPAFVAALPGAPATAGSLPTFDPFGTAWKIGSGVDALLDAAPVSFSTDNAGIVTATQTETASGLAIDIARSDTAAAASTRLSLTGVGSGVVVGGTDVRFSAQALFQGGAQQAVAASWSVTGLDHASVDSNGKLALPAVDVATPFTLSARWFDGSSVTQASTVLTVVPALRPIGLAIAGLADGSALPAGSTQALGATVQWSDGSASTPAATWRWTGDASAVAQLGSDGVLRAGKPAADSTIHVTASFTQGGVLVTADLTLTVSRFVRRVQSVSLTGLAAGQVLTAGDRVDLVLTAAWNDGTESTLAPTWNWSGSTSVIGFTVSSTGRLTTFPHDLPDSADAAARAPEADTVTAYYDNGDGSAGSLTVAFGIQPLLKIPTSLRINGAVALTENAATRYNVFVVYSDGTLEPTDATFSTSQPALLIANDAFANAFTAGIYATRPSAPQVARLVATRSFAYVDASGTAVNPTLTASIDVSVTWVEPTLTALIFAADHLSVGTSTPVVVSGYFHKFDTWSTQILPGATFTSPSNLVSTSGSSVTATQAPATLAASWVTLTASAVDPSSGQTLSVSHLATVDLPGNVPRHLLPYAYGPLDTDVQFRAISSDGHVDDYTVARALPRLLGYESPATRRRMRLFSGATDFVQSRMNPHVPGNAAQETQYVAAIERGQVVVLRHADLYNADSLAAPIVLPGVTNARSVALVARRDNVTPSLAAVRLYVLDQAGAVRQFTLPYTTSHPLASTDLQFERQLAGSYAQVSGGADFIQLLSTSGAAFSEGASESFALGDPAYAAHWNDTFAVQAGFSCSSTCAYTPLTNVGQVHASVDRSFVALADLIGSWGSVGPSTLQWTSATRTVGPAIDVTALATSAWLQSGGSVHFVNLSFAEDEIGGPGHIAVGSTRVELVATWLPTVTEIVDGRRNAAATQWPFSLASDDIAPTMPIVRTATDALYYLDGRAIVDPQGQPVVLP